MSKTLLVRNKKYCNRCISYSGTASIESLVTLPTKFFGLSAIFGTLRMCGGNFKLCNTLMELSLKKDVYKSKKKGANPDLFKIYVCQSVI